MGIPITGSQKKKSYSEAWKQMKPWRKTHLTSHVITKLSGSEPIPCTLAGFSSGPKNKILTREQELLLWDSKQIQCYSWQESITGKWESLFTCRFCQVLVRWFTWLTSANLIDSYHTERVVDIRRQLQLHRCLSARDFCLVMPHSWFMQCIFIFNYKVCKQNWIQPYVKTWNSFPEKYR